MKILLLASALALCAAPRVVSPAAPEARPAAPDHCRVDDPPPPLECPMCGGNIELHRKRTKFMAELRAMSLLAWMTTH